MNKTLLMLAAISLCTTVVSESYRIGIIGTGYVGLVSGACLAQLGHSITCCDIDKNKIEMLENGHVPIYEPGLAELIKENRLKNNLHFSSNVKSCIKNNSILILAVNTPSKENGEANLSALYSAIHTIINHINEHKTIIIKSTVPIGTNKKINEKILSSGLLQSEFDLVSNPEFLREGTAVHDFMHPDRIVIGVSSDQAANTMEKLYSKFLPETPLIMTNVTTSETIKYASNTFLALKITFINELANLCDITGAKTSVVAQAMGLDQRISPYFLKPGPGFGGSCFPKDSQALAFTAQEINSPMLTVQALLQANEIQKNIPIKKLKKAIGEDLKNKKIAVLGLAFKANTDDIRYSPAINVINQLIAEGALVQTYDPEAMKNMRLLFPDIEYKNSSYEALENADAAIILTDWQEFKNLKIEKMAKIMTSKVIIDCRNILNIDALTSAEFQYQTIGQGSSRSTRNCSYYYFCPDSYANAYR